MLNQPTQNCTVSFAKLKSSVNCSDGFDQPQTFQVFLEQTYGFMIITMSLKITGPLSHNQTPEGTNIHWSLSGIRKRIRKRIRMVLFTWK